MGIVYPLPYFVLNAQLKDYAKEICVLDIANTIVSDKVWKSTKGHERKYSWLMKISSNNVWTS